MAVYEYKGYDSEGKKKSGFLDAENLKAARFTLKEKRKIYPISLVESKRINEESIRDYFNISKYLSRVKKEEVVIFTRQLSTLISAGFQLTKALKTLLPQIKSVYFRNAMTQIRDSVEEGSSFSKALSLYPDIFSPTYINLVHAGESSGTLDLVLNRLAESSEDRMKMERKIRVALTYPVFMAVVAAIVIVFLITYVVPGILEIFSDLNHTPPLPTRILMFTTDTVKSFWYIVPVMVLIFHFSIVYIKRKKKGLIIIDRFKLSFPYSGPMIRKIATAKFCRTLSTLLENGVTMLKALDVSKNVISNTILKEGISSSYKEVEQGAELGKSLATRNIFPSLATEMIKVGEESGKLEEMLNRVADIYEDEVETQIIKITTLIEPAIILVMGGIALLIMLAVYLPIMEMNTLAK